MGFHNFPHNTALSCTKRKTNCSCNIKVRFDRFPSVMPSGNGALARQVLQFKVTTVPSQSGSD